MKKYFILSFLLLTGAGLKAMNNSNQSRVLKNDTSSEGAFVKYWKSVKKISNTIEEKNIYLVFGEEKSYFNWLVRLSFDQHKNYIANIKDFLPNEGISDNENVLTINVCNPIVMLARKSKEELERWGELITEREKDQEWRAKHPYQSKASNFANSRYFQTTTVFALGGLAMYLGAKYGYVPTK